MNLGGRPVVWTAERIQELGERLLAWSQDPAHWFLKEFAAAENIPASHLSRLSLANPAFAEIMERVSDILETRLLRGGLDSKLNHNIVKLICVSKYGYSEQTNVAVTAVAAKPVLSTVQDCERAIAEAEDQKRMLEGLVEDARLLPSIVVG